MKGLRYACTLCLCLCQCTCPCPCPCPCPCLYLYLCLCLCLCLWKRMIVSPAANNVITVTRPQVAIATTHGAASDDKSSQTDNPQSSVNTVKIYYVHINCISRKQTLLKLQIYHREAPNNQHCYKSRQWYKIRHVWYDRGISISSKETI